MKSKTLIESVEKGKKRQALAKSRSKRDYSEMSDRSKRSRPKPDRKKVKLQDEQSSESSPQIARPQKQEEPQEPEISFVLVRHNDENGLPQLANKYLRTSKKLTILHLCKFLAKKFNLEDFKSFSISFVENSNNPLDLSMTLDQIDKQFTPRENEELTLVYRHASGVQKNM